MNFIRMKDLEKKLSLKKSAIYEMIDAGYFLEPRRLEKNSRGTVWIEQEVDEWMKKLPTASASVYPDNHPTTASS